MWCVRYTSVLRSTSRVGAARSRVTLSHRANATTPSHVLSPSPIADDVCAGGQGARRRDGALSASVADSVLRLRNALETLSEAERLKAQSEVTAATSSLLRPPQAAEDASVSEGARVQTVAAGVTSSTTAMMTTTTKSWVRNKRAKFWAIVHPNSPPTAQVSAVQRVDACMTASSPIVRCASTGPIRTSAITPKTADTSLACSDGPAQPRAEAIVTGTPQAARCETSALPTRHVTFHNQHKRDVALMLSELLDKDPTFGPLLLEMLPAESRRLLLVIGTASEYFGADYDDVVEQVKEADRDRDYSISSTDYDAWAASSFEQRRQQQRAGGEAGARLPEVKLVTPHATANVEKSQRGDARRNSEGIAASPAAAGEATSLKRIVQVMQHVSPGGDERDVAFASPELRARVATTSKASNQSSLLATMGLTVRKRWRRWGRARPSSSLMSPGASHIPWQLYRRLLLGAAAPFLAFGVLDNGTLILAGDAIDRTMSQTFGLSAMAAAALGGVVSGVAGIQVHGLAERCTRAAPLVLTPAQRCGPHYHRAIRLGNTLGMVSGLLLGMLPLLFLGHSTEEKLKEEDERLRREAARSRLRRLRAIHNEEQTTRLSIEAEERKMLKALLALPSCSSS